MAPGLMGTEGMDFPKIKAPVLKINGDITGSIAVLGGIIISMWANCTFVTIVTDGRTDVFITVVSFLSHLLISYSFTVFLVQGFAKNKPHFLTPWIALKGLEMIFVFIAILIESFSYYRYIALVPVGVILLLIGCYLETMIYLAYKHMKENPNPPPPVDIETVSMTEKPPSYEAFTNQTNAI